MNGINMRVLHAVLGIVTVLLENIIHFAATFNACMNSDC